MSKPNIFYAQSGGVTAVINATASGVIQTARRHSDHFGNVYAGLNGITGALYEELVDTSKESDVTIGHLANTPAGAYGSCRYRLQDFNKNIAEYQRLIEVFKAHNIQYFLYNGGGDSQDTTYKISQISKKMGFPVTCIGLPKTVDNDLANTDTCPGFGSVAKYVAVSTLEAGLDVKSMCETSTKVFVLEVMGRHAGWIAAASSLARRAACDPPHIILFPEIPFVRESFLREVKNQIKQNKYCVIVVSEGVRNKSGKFLSAASNQDAFGHTQLGGIAPYIASLINSKLGLKCHWAVADYLQRSAGHIRSKIDVEQAYSLGCAAVGFALEKRQAVMTTIVRKSSRPYHWTIGSTPLKSVANKEKKMPRNFISANGFNVTRPCLNYLQPLIEGEPPLEYNKGIPVYAKLKNVLVRKKLPPWKMPK